MRTFKRIIKIITQPVLNYVLASASKNPVNNKVGYVIVKIVSSLKTSSLLSWGVSNGLQLIK